MLEIIKKIISAPIFKGDDEKTYAARLLNVILWAGIVIFIVAGIAIFGLEEQSNSFLIPGMLLILVIVYLGLVYATHWGYVKPVSYLVVTAAFIGIASSAAISGGILSPSSAAFITVALMAGLLLGQRVGILVTAITIVTGLALTLFGDLLPRDASSQITPISAWFTLTVITLSTTTFLILAVRNLNEAIQIARKKESELKSLTDDLENRVKERTTDLELANEKNAEHTAHLRTIAHISRTFTSLKELDDLLPEIARHISEAFGFYHVGIFLIDPSGEYAILRASNSEGGQKMLAQGHRLKIGQLGIVGFVARTGKSRIALDIGSDAVFFDNPDLPNTRSELALPLRIDKSIIGVLDVQSIARAAFNPEDIDTLSLLADQISISIQNARLFEETRLALAEAQSVYAQSSQTGWRDIAQRGATGYRFANGKIEILKEPVVDIPANAGKTGKKVPFGPNITNPELLSIPISVRGEKLGILNIRQPGRSTIWSDVEIRLYQSIVERLSFALENARLIEETTNRAERDRTITNISDKLSSSAVTETILRTAAEEISRVLRGSEVLVQLQPGALKDSNREITRQS